MSKADPDRTCVLDRRLKASERLRVAIAKSNHSQTACAEHLGTQVGRIRKFIDPDDVATIPLAHIMALPHEVLRHIVEGLATDIGCILVDAESADVAALISTAIDGSVCAADALKKAHEASADGYISPDEGAGLIEAGRRTREKGAAIEEIGKRALVARGLRITGTGT